MILIVALRLFPHGESQSAPKSCENFWSNLRDQTDDNEEKQTEDNSRLRGSESQLIAAAQWGYPNPEDAEDPMIAPPDYDVRQSGRFLELQNRDLWLRPTELSWHFPILMTIREEPFKNYRSRSSTKLKTMEDNIEEAKKQKTKRSDDEWNSAEWQPSSWSWQQPITWALSSPRAWPRMELRPNA